MGMVFTFGLSATGNFPLRLRASLLASSSSRLRWGLAVGVLFGLTSLKVLDGAS